MKKDWKYKREEIATYECQSCGNKYNSKGWLPKCPKCNSSIIREIDFSSKDKVVLTNNK